MGQKIPRVCEDSKTESALKYVGVFIDEKLTFKKHIEKINTKMMYWIHMIANARYCMPKSMRLTLYNTLIKPHLEYCVEIWGKTFDKYKNKVVIAQKRAIRVINLQHFRCHTKTLFEQDKIMDFDSLYKFKTFCTAHNIWYGKSPITLIKRADRLRYVNQFYEPIVRQEKIKNFVIYNLKSCWNKLSNDERKIENHKTFMKMIKKDILLKLK